VVARHSAIAARIEWFGRTRPCDIGTLVHGERWLRSSHLEMADRSAQAVASCQPSGRLLQVVNGPHTV
jgi:hypothetical protein